VVGLQEGYVYRQAVVIEPHLNCVTFSRRMNIGMSVRDIETSRGKASFEKKQLIQQT
jgi:hypothetical protein